MTKLSGANLNNGAAVGPQSKGMESPSTFPTYPAYKDSGTEWLGEVPAHWSVTRLGRVSDIESGYPFPAEQFVDDGIPVTRMSDLKEGRVSFDSIKKVAENNVPIKAMAKVDDLLIGLSGSISNFAQIIATDLPLAVNQRVGIIRSGNPIAAAVTKYFILSQSFICQIESAVPETTILNISMEQVRSCALAWPPRFELTQIARFLDHETARIDALIEEQQRLIELLKEKRQAVISHAVTKGLDPTVQMKDSGVEWLGEVPEHWGVLRIGAVYSEAVEKGLAELPVLRVSIHYGVSDRELTEEESDRKITRIDDREKYKRVRHGDLVYNMMRAWQGGFGAVLVDGLVSPAYVVARPISMNISRYVEQLLRTGCAIEEMRKNSYGITDFRLRLYWDQFKNIYIAVPPERERQQIMLRIDSLISESDALRNEADILINILQERRSALISAAVTGKIDVRSWQPPANAPSPEFALEAL
ncbi:restriction endonuclease S subunit [Pseudomonas sp. GM49]|uniref:restriction endonuclease subunit S n=1 Tax=Pseudomonas sp. GM49 TaxID=1144331 RepID=UPI0002709163|nr:restriction endonuclease subunit S [Pseudomonas sp. GM49]EJM75730.1 restriction endonuclease S subunit [Pseudomonas sp. GM49]